MDPLHEDQINPLFCDPETLKKELMEAELRSKTSKPVTEKQASESQESDKQAPSKKSGKKDFEEFKRLMLDDPNKKLADLTYREVDELMREQPHEMAEKFKAAHKRAVLSRRGNSRLRNHLDDAVDEFATKTGLDPEHFPYEEYLKNDTVRTHLLLVLLVALLAFFAPFGVVYLGVALGKGLKAAYPKKFSFVPL